MFATAPQKMCTVASALLLAAAVLLVTGPAATHAKHVHHRVHHRAAGDEAAARGSCESYFDKLNVTIAYQRNGAGPICGGHCCDNATEQELTITSSNQFANNLRIHTQNLRRTLEKTAETYKGHLLQLTHSSENKTLAVFTQVYRRMSPLSRHPIVELYQQIRNHINGQNAFPFDTLVHKFFSNLFPVAYHQAIHSKDSSNGAAHGDFHSDYKNCLQHTFNDLQPFGSIPDALAISLQHSIGAATLFVTALDRAADILASTEDINADALSAKCRQHLLQLTHCSKCNGIEAPQAKSCKGYCTNVMRGCLAQYIGVLDSPWSKVAESIDQMWRNSVQTSTGAEEVLKALDAKLSAAIMHTMENAEELEKKVTNACGNPTLLPTDADGTGDRFDQATQSGHHHQHKPMPPPPNAEMLVLMVNIVQSKDYYAKIVDRICDEDDYEQTASNAKCWTGHSVGHYTQHVIGLGGTHQYNPEVPLEPDQDGSGRSARVNELVDKLIKLRHMIEKPAMASAYSDVQSDMGHTYDENEDINDGGSGYRDENNDDEEYTVNGGSGDGSGNGYGPSTPDNDMPDTIGRDMTVTAPPSAAISVLASPMLASLAFAVLSLLAMRQH